MADEEGKELTVPSARSIALRDDQKNGLRSVFPASGKLVGKPIVCPR
jgi:hypothetical protein